MNVSPTSEFIIYARITYWRRRRRPPGDHRGGGPRLGPPSRPIAAHWFVTVALPFQCRTLWLVEGAAHAPTPIYAPPANLVNSSALEAAAADQHQVPPNAADDSRTATEASATSGVLSCAEEAGASRCAYGFHVFCTLSTEDLSVFPRKTTKLTVPVTIREFAAAVSVFCFSFVFQG